MENLFISVALALGKMLRHSNISAFFLFQLKRKQKPKEAVYSHSYPWDLLFCNTDVIKKRVIS